jgi:hypothetical protein
MQKEAEPAEAEEAEEAALPRSWSEEFPKRGLPPEEPPRRMGLEELRKLTEEELRARIDMLSAYNARMDKERAQAPAPRPKPPGEPNRPP